MFGKNRSNDAGTVPQPAEEPTLREQMSQHKAMQEKSEMESREQAVMLHYDELHHRERCLDEREKNIYHRLGEFRADLDLMAKYLGFTFQTLPSKRALTSIDGPDPRQVTKDQTVAAVLEKVADKVDEIIEDYDDSVDDRITALNGRLQELATLVKAKKR